MPSRAQKSASAAKKTNATTTTSEENAMPKNTATENTGTTSEENTTVTENTNASGTVGSVEAQADEPITVNIALAIKIVPSTWTPVGEVADPRDVLVRKIMLEKSVDESKAGQLADFMIENGLADLLAKPSNGAGVNEVRRDIREYVRDHVALMTPFANATVELNEARRTNHKPKDADSK
ncbi:MAG: hypothetical protein FWE35_10955 [Streptosporangiales bacterium]|nr:hypothetical protein [Streptosporangiales bacterium]